MAFDFPSSPTIGQVSGNYAWDGEKWITAGGGGDVALRTELIEHDRPIGSAIAAASAVNANVCTVTLPPGDWELWGNLYTTIGGGTTTSAIEAAISTVSATMPTRPSKGGSNLGQWAAFAGNQGFLSGQLFVSIAVTTTFYLVANVTFGVSTLSLYGYLGAKRRYITGGVSVVVPPASDGMQFNGSMEVSQENAATLITVPLTTSKYIVDGFYANYTHAANTAVMKAQQVAPPGSPSFGAAFQSCLQFTSTTAMTAPAAADFAQIAMPIEGYRFARAGFGAAGASSITIGFWVYATVAGVMAVCMRNNAFNRSIAVNVTVNAPLTWEWKTVTIAGDTAGTWLKNNGVGAIVNFVFTCGTGYQIGNNVWVAGNALGTAANTNFFATANNVVCITGVVVLPGAYVLTAAQSPMLMRPYDSEIAIARRYWQQLNQANGDFFTLYGYNTTGTTPQQTFLLGTEMRASPVGTVVGVWNLANATGPTLTGVTARAFSMYATVTATGAFAATMSGVGNGLTFNARL